MNDLFDLFDLPDFSELNGVEKINNIGGIEEISGIDDLLNHLELKSLTDEEKEKIDKRIQDLIDEKSDKRRLISRLLLNSITILIVKESKLDKDGFINYFWNKSLLIGEQQVTLSSARYAAYSLLKQVINKGYLSWELAITALGKLTHMQKKDEDNLNLYGRLRDYFTKLVNNFEKSFYQLKGGYEASSDFDIITFLVLEFINDKEGEWTASDLILLKSKLEGMKINIDHKVTIEEFYKYLIKNPSICNKFYQNLSRENLEDLDLFEAPLIKGIEKIIKLDNEEQIIYDTLVKELENAGISYKEDEIKARLIGTYLMNDAFVDIKQEIETFNFAVELLSNLDLVWDYQIQVEFDDLSSEPSGDIAEEEEVELEDDSQEIESSTESAQQDFFLKIRTNGKSAKDEIDDNLEDEQEEAIKGDREKGEELLLRSRENNVEEAMALIDEGAAVNIFDNRNRTALMYATQFEDIRLIKKLINAGADVNVRDNRGKTALFEAISSNNEDIVKLLLDSGADPRVKYRGSNAFEIATMWNRVDIIKLLQKYIQM